MVMIGYHASHERFPSSRRQLVVKAQETDIVEGVSGIYLHNVNLEHGEFIEDFGKRTLPFLRK